MPNKSATDVEGGTVVFTFPSPFGRLGIRITSKAVERIWWHTGGVTLSAAEPMPGEEFLPVGVASIARMVQRQLADYFVGKRYGFRLPLLFHGSEFQIAVWRQVAAVPYGARQSYRDLAVSLGMPRAVRAVANAVAANPFVIVIPCHRIVHTSGALGGYAGGVERKKLLLDFEQTAQAQAGISSCASAAGPRRR